MTPIIPSNPLPDSSTDKGVPESSGVSTGTGKAWFPPGTWLRAWCAAVCCRWPRVCLVLARWQGKVFGYDPEGLELQTGVMALALGLWLLSVPAHAEQRPSNFGLMLLRLWPASVWASFFLLVGAFQIVAVLRSGVRTRCVCAMSGFFLWLFVAVLLALDGLSGPWVSVFPVVALSEAWVYLRLSVPARRLRCVRRRVAREERPTPISVADYHS